LIQVFINGVQTMITLTGAILGFIGSMIPELLAFFKQKADRVHELEILKFQREQQAAGHSERMEEIRISHDTARMQALYGTYTTQIRWVDALNGSVRPVMAYAFFLLYAVVKLTQFAMIPEGESPLPWQLWGQEDQAIFSAIVSFYFGQRAFSKVRS
jgi:Holin of 3TMs, for gene-transfer release